MSISVLTELKELFQRIGGITEADLANAIEKARVEADTEAAKLKADVQAAIRTAKAEALATFEADMPEIKNRVNAALASLEAAVIRELG